MYGSDSPYPASHWELLQFRRALNSPGSQSKESLFPFLRVSVYGTYQYLSLPRFIYLAGKSPRSTRMAGVYRDGSHTVSIAGRTPSNATNQGITNLPEDLFHPSSLAPISEAAFLELPTSDPTGHQIKNVPTTFLARSRTASRTRSMASNSSNIEARI